MIIRIISIAPLIAVVVFWTVQIFALTTDCGIGYLYTDIWFCGRLSTILDTNYATPILLLAPWFFLIIYGYRRWRKHKISRLEHFLIAGLFLMYVGFFAYLVLSGYSG